ncbi:MAG: HAMP domain-containing histidine kinase [Acidobacteria bacterium]|nr:HAMP domain-containing histidine kinase [Acidobacteriota bacterium]
MDPLELRDHAADILRATAWDMKSAQSATQQSDKSKGEGLACAGSDRVDGASDVHAVGRINSGFDLLAVVAEYRALRASVIRLWRESQPTSDLRDLEDLTRFNESIDQSLTEAVRSYTQRVDRSRQMFLAILGHDLRNPLQSIMMSADALPHGAETDPLVSGAASRISASVTSMARMINDLLDFTGIGLGAAMPLSPAVMDLRCLCREVIDEMRAAHPTRTFRFEPQGEFTGVWDAPRLRQMVSNLLGNDVQHGDVDGPIDLSISTDGAEVRLAVHNEGLEIPQDVLPMIFDPLVRLSSPQSQQQRRPGSIGLGLYIVREIAKAHGGDIEVDSSAEAGTVFTVRFPRRRAALLEMPIPLRTRECA